MKKQYLMLFIVAACLLLLSACSNASLPSSTTPQAEQTSPVDTSVLDTSDDTEESAASTKTPEVNFPEQPGLIVNITRRGLSLCGHEDYIGPSFLLQHSEEQYTWLYDFFHGAVGAECDLPSGMTCVLELTHGDWSLSVSEDFEVYVTDGDYTFRYTLDRRDEIILVGFLKEALNEAFAPKPPEPTVQTTPEPEPLVPEPLVPEYPTYTVDAASLALPQTTITAEWTECVSLYREVLENQPEYQEYYTNILTPANLLDLDDNGLPELLLYATGGEHGGTMTVLTVENGVVCRLNSYPAMDPGYLELPMSQNAIETGITGYGGYTGVVDLTVNVWNWDWYYGSKPVLRYLDTKTGEIVWLVMAMEYSSDVPSGYDPTNYSLSVTTVWKFGQKDGALAAEPLYQWYSIRDWYNNTGIPITDEAVREAELTELSERYHLILGIDYGQAFFASGLDEMFH